MKSKSITRIALCAISAFLILLSIGACGRNQAGDTYAPAIYAEMLQQLESEKAELQLAISQLETTIALLEATVSAYRADNTAAEAQIHVAEIVCTNACVMLELPELWAEITGTQRFTQAATIFGDDHDVRGQIRVFERGNSNIRLFPDGNFIANLWHNTKISGTYRELTQGDETAVLFTHNGKTHLAGGVSTFENTGTVTVVGGIVDGILTMPIDWDDGHGHGMEFNFIAYPLVFLGENGQRITLYADNTFVASFAGDVTIIGFYGMRAASVSFVPGSPTFSSGGLPVGSFLLARLVSCGDEIANDYAHELGHIEGDSPEQEQEQEQAPPATPAADSPAQEQPQNNVPDTSNDNNDDDADDAVPYDNNGTNDADDTPTDPDHRELEWCDDCGDYH